MRKKIEELRNREEGFTLVELLAVIVILGIIVAISIPAIGNVVNNARGGATEAEKELVLDAARLYTISEVEDENFKDDTLNIDVQTDLVAKGYLDTKEGEKFEGNVIITKKTNGNYEYKLDEKFKKVVPKK